MDILANIEAIKKRIETACERVGRNPSQVKLLLATKMVSPQIIKIALTSGNTLIAENKVQELKEKYEALKEIPHTNHFIGHLQTNKIKDILKCDVACVQSVDRFDLAEKLHQKLVQENKTMEILIQVNTSAEASKFGVSPENALALVKKVSELKSLKINGLMTIGVFSSDQTEIRKCYQLLKKIQQEIISEKIEGVFMNELSMGMSGDLEIAIEEGATIIRVGSAVFGERIYM